MDTKIGAVIEQQLIEEFKGYTKVATSRTPMMPKCEDIGQLQVHFYQLEGSPHQLEIHTIGYKTNSKDESSPVSSVNVLVLLKSSDGYRLFGGSKFIEKGNDNNELTIRAAMRELLEKPDSKMKNAANPATECFSNHLIRSAILAHLAPKEVLRLERVSTSFHCSMLEPSVDHSFWRPLFLRLYEDDDANRTYREKFAVKKREELALDRSFRWFPRQLIPQFPPRQPVPGLPRPFNPDPALPRPFHPLQPHRPNPDPGNPPQRPPFPFPPLLGDFDQSNWIPGMQPRGDPLDFMPGRERRGRDPDMPEGPSRGLGPSRGGRGGGPPFGGGGGYFV